MRYLLAGGLFGILAAANEEVDWSYRVNVPLIFFVGLPAQLPDLPLRASAR